MFRYIRFGYTRDLYAENGSDIALIAAPIGGEANGNSGRLLIEAEGWRRIVDPDEQDYVDAVFEDLRSLPDSELSAAMDSLSGMSSGCLRTNATGTCTAEELSRLKADLHPAPQRDAAR